VTPATPAVEAGELPLYVVKRGWHVDIGIAVADLQKPLQSVGAAFRDSRYLLFGFGDRRYLLHGGAGNMIAALWSGAGLVLVTETGSRRPEDVFGDESVVRLSVTAPQMSALQAFIANSLARRDGSPVPVEPGPHAGGTYSGYYASVQHYSALHTCNTWVAEALQSAGLPITSSGVEFADQLWHQVQQLRSEAGARPPLSGFVGVAAPGQRQVAAIHAALEHVGLEAAFDEDVGRRGAAPAGIAEDHVRLGAIERRELEADQVQGHVE
jgi:hypothetical protein